MTKTGTGSESPGSHPHPHVARPTPPWGVRALRAVKEPIEYWLFLSLHFIARLVPFSAATAFGGFLGECVFRWTNVRKRVTLDNLRHAFPEKSESERRTIACGAYRNYGISVTQMLWAGGASREALASKVHLDDETPFRNGLAQGKGVLLLSAHFGSWEFLANAVHLRLGIPFLSIVQNQRNRRINAYVDRVRRRFGGETVDMEHSVRATLRALAERRVVLLLGDQSGSRESVFVEFFGRPAATHRGAAAFSLKSGAPIVMLFLVRRSDGGVDGIFEEVDRTGLTGAGEKEVEELTRRHVAMLEKMICRYPDHWLWMHKRWKHTPDGNGGPEPIGPGNRRGS